MVNPNNLNTKLIDLGKSVLLESGNSQKPESCNSSRSTEESPVLTIQKYEASIPEIDCYTPPEAISKLDANPDTYDYKGTETDMWSCGIVLF